VDYNIGNILDRLNKLEQQVLQMAVSPRVGTFRVSADFKQEYNVLATTATAVWADFIGGTPSVTLITGRVALVLFMGHPLIYPEDRFESVGLSYKVDGATTIPAGNITGTNEEVRMAYVPKGSNSFGIASPNSAGAFQAFVERTLNPGENTFRLQARYTEKRTSFDPFPTVGDKGIIVVPLDI